VHRPNTALWQDFRYERDVIGNGEKMNDLIIDEIFQQFAKLIEERFYKKVYTTEDSIRYTLFYCLTRSGGIHPSDIILEYPHPRIPRAKIDTYISPKNEYSELVFEFKFDRGIPSGNTSPRTQQAGKIFADIFRLALFELNDNVQRYFVYVTDNEMATYFQNLSNQLNDFFNLTFGNILKIDKQYIEKLPNTFTESLGNNVIDCEIVCRLNKELESKFWVRIYEIKTTNIR